MDPMRVLVTEALSDSGLEILRQDLDVSVRPELAESGLGEAVGEFDALIVRSQTKVTAEVLDRSDRLKVIGRAGIGLCTASSNRVTTGECTE